MPRKMVGFPLLVLQPPQRQCACPYGVATVELTQAEIRSGDIFKNEVKRVQSLYRNGKFIFLAAPVMLVLVSGESDEARTDALFLPPKQRS